MKNHNAFAWEIWTTINFNGKFKGNLCFQPMIKKYMVLESYISEIWYFRVNEKNIIFFVHYILFTYAFPKLPFNVSLSTYSHPFIYLVTKNHGLYFKTGFYINCVSSSDKNKKYLTISWIGLLCRDWFFFFRQMRYEYI